MLFLWFASLFAVSRSDNMSCGKTLADCEKNIFCSGALYKILGTGKCSSALGYDYEKRHFYRAMQMPCPLSCVFAIQNLTEIPEGKAWKTCQCDISDSNCLTVKARLERCIESRRVNYTIFSCMKARKECSNQTECNKAQGEFLQSCSQLINGVNCTKNCKNSQKRLLSLELGKALLECECDGVEERYCRGIRAHYEALCKGPRDPRDHTSTSPDPKYKPSISGTTIAGEVFMWTVFLAIIGNVYFLFI